MANIPDQDPFSVRHDPWPATLQTVGLRRQEVITVFDNVIVDSVSPIYALPSKPIEAPQVTVDVMPNSDVGSYTLTVYGSLDGVTFFTLASSSQLAPGEPLFVVNKLFKFLQLEITGLALSPPVSIDGITAKLVIN